MNPQYRQQIVQQLSMRGIPATEENIARVASSSGQPTPQMPQGPSTGMQLAQAGVGMVGTELGRRGVEAGINAIAPSTAPATAAAPAMLASAPAAAAPAIAPITTNSAVNSYMAAATPAPLAPTTAQNAPSVLGTVAPYIPVGIGAYGLYNTIDNSYKYQQRGKDLGMTAAQGAASGAAIGSFGGPIGMGIGAGVGGLIGLASGYFGSSKDAHQQTRDAARDRMEQLGIYEHTPATKESFSMGGDGKYRLPDGRRSYEIVKGQAEGRPERDYTPEEAQAVGLLNPLGMIVAGSADTKDSKIKAAGNAVGLLYNQLDQNVGEAGVNMDEIRSLYDKAGADQGSMFKALEIMRQGGAISEEQQAAANNAINQLYGQEYYTEQASPEEQAMNEIKAFELLGINKDKKR